MSSSPSKWFKRLLSGEIIELAAEPAPVQLDLFGTDECIQGGHDAKVAHCRNYLT